MNNLELWNSWKQPPKEALKQITGGRMNGKTDISPMWRYQVLTEKYGAIGIGWYYTIEKLWPETGSDGQVMAMATIKLYLKDGDKWSMPVEGIGGNMLIKKEGTEDKPKYFTSDEGYKMAVTDALSVACKMLGIGADIYLGNFDGSKYINESPKQPTVQDLRAVCEQRYTKVHGAIDESVKAMIVKLETVEEIRNWMKEQKITKDDIK